jgi:hypothetical protein
MNRHERRKYRAELERVNKKAFGVWTVEVGTPESCGHPELSRATACWVSAIQGRKPLCLLCDLEWLTLGGLPPKKFVYLYPWDQPFCFTDVIIAAVCVSCCALHADSAIAEVAIRILPDGRFLGKPSRSTAAVQ